MYQAKLPFKKVRLGCPNKKGQWVVAVGPNRKIGDKKVSAQVLGLPLSQSGKLKSELPKPRSAKESSMLEAPPLEQGLISGMIPISVTSSPGGVSGESAGTSSLSLSGVGDSVGYTRTREIVESTDDPLESEVPLCMVLKDGRSFSMPGNDGTRTRVFENPIVQDIHASSGVEMPFFHFTEASAEEKDKSPWVNKKFLGFCKTVGVSVEGFEEAILRILKEMENRRCLIRKHNESKRGTSSVSRKDRELKKLVSSINYDGLAGREAEEGMLGRQMTVVPYEA